MNMFKQPDFHPVCRFASDDPESVSIFPRSMEAKSTHLAPKAGDPIF